jgi:chromosome segregation ATPase
MKPISLLTFILLLASCGLLLTSCGLGEKEKTARLQEQKAKDDSLHIAELQRLKEAESFRSALNDSLSAYTAQLTHQQHDLAQLRTAIYAANDELSEIKQSHPDQAPQVQRQEMKIQSMLVQQISLQSSAEHLQAEITQIRSQLATARR